MSQLFVFINADGVQWLELDLDARTQLDSATVPNLEQLNLPARFNGKAVVLVVATEWVLLHQIELAKGAKKESLPWLIESQLLMDIESQYWYDCYSHNRVHTIALLDQSLLNYWVDTLASQQLSLCALLPDAWLLPHRTGVTTLLQQHDRLLLATDNLMAAALPASLARAVREEFACPQVEAWGLDEAQQRLWRDNTELVVYPKVDSLVNWMANNWRGEAGILPPKLRVKKSKLKVGNLKYAALLFCVSFMLILSAWLSLVELRENSARSELQYQTQLQQYPQFQGLLVKDVLQQLDRITTDNHQNLTDQLDGLSQLLIKLPSELIVALRYNANSVEVNLSGEKNIDVLQLTNNLEAAGYATQWRSSDRMLSVEVHFDSE
jgi:type II secretory pathway component PulL